MSVPKPAFREIPDPVWNVFKEALSKKDHSVIHSLLKGCVFLEATVDLGKRMVGKNAHPVAVGAAQMASLWLLSQFHGDITSMSSRDLSFIEPTYQRFLSILGNYPREVAEFYLEKVVRNFWQDILNSSFYKRTTALASKKSLPEIFQGLKRLKGGSMMTLALTAFLISYAEHNDFINLMNKQNQEL